MSVADSSARRAASLSLKSTLTAALAPWSFHMRDRAVAGVGLCRRLREHGNDRAFSARELHRPGDDRVVGRAAADHDQDAAALALAIANKQHYPQAAESFHGEHHGTRGWRDAGGRLPRHRGPPGSVELEYVP